MERITIDVTRSAGSRRVHVRALWSELQGQLAPAKSVWGSVERPSGPSMDGRLVVMLREAVQKALTDWSQQDELPF